MVDNVRGVPTVDAEQTHPRVTSGRAQSLWRHLTGGGGECGNRSRSECPLQGPRGQRRTLALLNDLCRQVELFSVLSKDGVIPVARFVDVLALIPEDVDGDHVFAKPGCGNNGKEEQAMMHSNLPYSAGDAKLVLLLRKNGN